MARKIKMADGQRVTRTGRPYKETNDVYKDASGKFKPGNPGKPEGAIAHRNRFLMSVLNCWGDQQENHLKTLMSMPSRLFLEAMDRVIKVYEAGGKGFSFGMGIDGEMPGYKVTIETEGSSGVANQAQTGQDIP